MVESGIFREKLKSFIQSSIATKQDDQEIAIDNFCQAMESYITELVKSATITIPTGAIQVVGSVSSQANVIPIILNNVIS